MTVTTSAATKRPGTRTLSRWMLVGLLLTLVSLLTLVADLVGPGTLDVQQRSSYPPGYRTAAIAAEQSTTLIYLFAVGVLGALCWIWLRGATIRAKRWVRSVATAVFVLGTGEALFAAGTVLPAWLGIIRLLPCAAGLVAIVLMWTAANPDHARSGT